MTSDDNEWLGATVQYEGYPMALRVRPRATTTDHRARLQYLAALTQQLAHVRKDGLPEAAYNRSLFDLDLSVVAALEEDASGLTVIVETFAGKRRYYAYVTDPARAEAALGKVRRDHPGHELSLSGRPDPTWELYSEYERLFPW